jgi:hypothetical protein
MEWIHPNMHVRRLLGMAVVTIAMSLAGWWVFNLLTPPQHNPFKPLDLAIRPGIATGFKLDGLSKSPPLCFALLDKVGVTYTHVDRQSDNPDCGIANGLTLDQSLTPYSGTLTMSCKMAASLYLWERHVVMPAAAEIFGQPVKRIETLGAYACRRVNGAKTRRWSEHARGEAVDIAGFTLADGTRVMVKDDFSDFSPEGIFLRRVRDKGCAIFSVALSPDYNAQHADHLHFDMGAFAICR